MIEQIYYTDRIGKDEDGVFTAIKKEMIDIYLANKDLLDAKLNAAESYTFDAHGVRVLTPDCEPFRTIECSRLIIKNDVVVGNITLRVRNDRPKHGINFLMDSMSRTYELRFKTFAGCDFTVESSGISVCQQDKGSLIVGTSNLTGFAENILKRHWAEFKDLCIFTATDLDNPTRISKWSKARIVNSRV